MGSPRLKAAARLVLEEAARQSRPPLVSSITEGAPGPVLLLRSGGVDLLTAFLVRLRESEPHAAVFLVGRRGDSVLLRRLWTGSGTCHEMESDAPFRLDEFVEDAALCERARACSRRVFLMRNASASGYANVVEIMRLLSAGVFFGWTHDGTIARFDPASMDSQQASARLRDALVEWAAMLPVSPR